MDITSPQLENNKGWKESVNLFIIALLVVIPFRMFIAQPFIVDGASMDPAFETSDYLIVDELTYHFSDPERGSVLIFKYPRNPKKYFVKRVIGLPHETIVIKDGQVTIKNEAHPEGFVLNEPYVVLGKIENGTFETGDKEYFVMGDNRAGSADSRMWGSVPEANIIGRPILRVSPFGFLPQDERDLFRN